MDNEIRVKCYVIAGFLMRSSDGEFLRCASEDEESESEQSGYEGHFYAWVDPACFD